MLKDEGVSIMYRGLESTLVSLATSNFIYFYTNNVLKVIYKKQSGQEISTGVNLLIASLAGVVNVLTTNPLWTVNTRLKLQRNKSGEAPRYRGLIHGIRKVIKEEGVPELWSGGLILLLHFFCSPCIQTCFS